MSGAAMRTRRRFLASAAAFGAAALPAPALAQGRIMPKRGKRAVVVGGGWGGCTAAKYIRMQDPSIETALIEPAPLFLSCPVSNRVIAGFGTMDDIAWPYDRLASVHGVTLLRGAVSGIDPAARTVRLAEGELRYDRLILSPGIALRRGDIDGLEAAPPEAFPAAWKAGPETELLRRQLAAMPDGGAVVLSIPRAPFRCPPGPYERISLIADFLKRNKPRAKIVALDANAKIVSKGKLFAAAWERLYPGIVEYRPDSAAVAVDASRRVVSTDFEDIAADVANVVPPQEAGRLLFDAGLVPAGRRWAPVNPRDFSSALAPDIHIIGDATDGSTVGRVPKSGYIANSMGKVCAAAVVAALNGREPPRPAMTNTCYSLVSRDEGISVTAIYDYDDTEKKILPVKGASGLSPASSALIKRRAEDWARAIRDDMLG